MGSQSKNLVTMLLVREISEHGWKSKKNSTGVDGHRNPSALVEHTVSFTIVGNRAEGIYFQPGLGVRFLDVNKMKSKLTPQNFNRDAFTAYFPLARLRPNEHIDLMRWFIPVADVDATTAAVHRLASDVFSLVAESEFFEKMLTVVDYLSAVEQQTWPLYESGGHHYLAALLLEGRDNEARLAAIALKDEYLREMKLAGLTPEMNELAPYNRVLELTEGVAGSDLGLS